MKIENGKYNEIYSKAVTSFSNAKLYKGKHKTFRTGGKRYELIVNNFPKEDGDSVNNVYIFRYDDSNREINNEKDFEEYEAFDFDQIKRIEVTNDTNTTFSGNVLSVKELSIEFICEGGECKQFVVAKDINNIEKAQLAKIEFDEVVKYFKNKGFEIKAV